MLQPRVGNLRLVHLSRPAGRCCSRGRRLTLIGSGVIQVVENRNQHVQHVAALQDKEQEFLWQGTELMKLALLTARLALGGPLSNLVEVAELPEEHQQLLVELDLLGGVWQVGLGQRVVEETSQALQNEVKVLPGRHRTGFRHGSRALPCGHAGSPTSSL